MKLKPVLIGVLAGTIAIPTVVAGGSFTVSLIQGLSPAEAVQVLAEQIDTLTGRIENIEAEQSKSELWQAKEDACNKARDFMSANMPTGYDWFLTTISHRKNDITNLENQINLPSCQQCSAEDIECKNLVNQQQDNGECIISTAEIKADLQNRLDAEIRPELSRLISIKEQYLLLKQECDDLTTQYDSL